MSYVDAPATKMLASHCACCGRPLVDAKSVECGVGPECRKKHGFDILVSEEARTEANKLVYLIALDQGDGAQVVEAIARLREIGFDALTDRVLRRLNAIRVDRQGDRLEVKSPYNPDAVPAFRQIPGRSWDSQKKVNVVPASSSKALLEVLKQFYPGRPCIGSKGVFAL